MFGEQMAIMPDGRTAVTYAGIWSDDQIEGHARVCAVIERMGGVPAIQLGHTGRKRSELRQANEILRKASAYFAMAELDRPLKR